MKLYGIKKAVGEIKRLPEDYASYYEVFLNLKTGHVFTVYQVSVGYNAWTKWDTDKIIKIGDYGHPVTMAKLKETSMYRLEQAVREERINHDDVL